jgi:hypothetical protein
MSEWQPIETAPKDETRVLLVASYGTMHTAFWRDGLWRCGGMGQYFNNPTHWMPLPEPPK